jgi:transcriptional regulator with XRE-family HTH domain
MAGPETPEPADTDFGIGAVREKTPLPSPLGAGYLLLVVRELSGLSRRSLARAVGTSQLTLATFETGNRTPTIRTLMRVAQATAFELVIGLRRPGAPRPDPAILHAHGFDLLGTLRPDPQDGLRRFRRAPRAEPVRRPPMTRHATGPMTRHPPALSWEP